MPDITRPALSDERVQLNAAGQVELKLKPPWRDGTTHRVMNPRPERAGRARYSLPFFLHFNPDFEIRTLQGCAGPSRPDRYPEPITADAYLQQRLREIKLA